MAVSYEELTGSPVVTLDRKGGSATRRFRIAWADISAFAAECFPNPSSGYGQLGAVPGFPWLLCQKVVFAPFSDGGEAAPDDDADGPLNDYSNCGALVTAEYSVPDDDQQQSSGGSPGNPDKTGPGGDDGSSGGEEVEWIRHEVTVGGEWIGLPAEGLEWEQGNPNNPFDAGKAASDRVNAGAIYPTIQHVVTLMHVRRPPWAAIRSLLGKVNASKYAGGSADHVMFLGGEFRWGRDSTGNSEWECTYKFVEKLRSWQEFFRPETGRFEVLRRLGGGKIFETGNFALLFQSLYV